MADAPYHLSLPEERLTSVIFASPHSGRDYPAEFLARSVLDRRTIRSSEDAFIDTLLKPATELGAPLLVANAPRAYIDLNRAAEELDPAVIEGVRPNGHNPRVSSGLGVIPRVVAGGRAIYRGKISLAEADARIEGVWKPYHACLCNLVSESVAMFGEAILIDVHSMPHESLEAIAPMDGRRPEIVLGDRFGASAGSAIVDRIEAAFAAAGLLVARNAPFAGAYVTQTYGRPSQRRHAVQIEIDRSLYMNEALIRPNGQFPAFRRLMAQVIAEIVEIGRGELRLAAE
ncbi:N-formylglutamate amidohydrolase [Ostreiculturibacter nitratireducens]|uniref:N-formylglutamate amidohydrolase n=1 Tax=Ostreiculturibacter nitratireducens TaxID=3075226 RepID=UPI0031B642E0